ncbi:MAG: AMP-binding protein [Phycisphaerales bacterium]
MTEAPWNRPLSPLSFLDRSASVFADRVAVTDHGEEFTYAEFDERTRRQAGALSSIGVEPGSRVAVLGHNSRVLLESHYGVPRAGAVLVALNNRLKPGELAYIVEHSGAEVLIADGGFEEEARDIVGRVPGVRLLNAGGHDSEYEHLLDSAEPVSLEVADETSLISINYTSGTTGLPKGVMYHHRGAYLQALAMAFHNKLDSESGFLWTLPMFHCNGWCFTWAVTAAGGHHICLDRIDPGEIWALIRSNSVSHFNAAPTVLTMLSHHPAATEGPAERAISVGTGGAPPSPTLLAEMSRLNIEVTHLYGLTETFGPVTLCEWLPEWNELPDVEQARIKARQGVGNVVSERLRVVNAAGDDVPKDGLSVGEVAIRGNNLMKGYYRDPTATSLAMPDGWFRTGDLGVMHPDGYVELRDRAKDIIISGGENIASIEVEQVLMAHPAVAEAAVVAMPHEKWGEVPVAFVHLKFEASVTEPELIDHVREHLAHFKAPKKVVFSELPKTSTGKVQKVALRELAKDLDQADGS